METNLRRNTKYQILTPNGWSNFDGISVKINEDNLKLSFDDGSTLICSDNHRLKFNNNYVEAKNLKLFDIFGNKKLIKKEEINKFLPLYDPFNIHLNNEYFSEDLIHHNCNSFQGSSGTLIAGWKLRQMRAEIPVHKKDGIHIYENPIPQHKYVITADVSEGKFLDYSAFQCIDITTLPYKQVCTYYDNSVAAGDFSQVLYRMCKYYNSAFLLIEYSSLGPTIADAIFNDFEYEGLLCTEHGGPVGKRISFKANADKGIKMSNNVKAMGCSLLKLIIEQNILPIIDENTIKELEKFSRKDGFKNKWQAEKGSHDDLTMCLVLFAWLTDQQWFKDHTSLNTFQKMVDKDENTLMETVLPFLTTSEVYNLEDLLPPPLQATKGWLWDDENPPETLANF